MAANSDRELQSCEAGRSVIGSRGLAGGDVGGKEGLSKRLGDADIYAQFVWRFRCWEGRRVGSQVNTACVEEGTKQFAVSQNGKERPARR